MSFAYPPSQTYPASCAECRSPLPSAGSFCSQCGASFDVGNQNPPSRVYNVSDGIGALEDAVAAHPDDASYRQLLAIALHDDALKDWWTDPKDGELLCVSYSGFVHAKTRIEQALKLNIGDAALQQTLAQMAEHVNSAEQRKFSGSWLMVVVLGFFYIIPGVLWWYVNRRPGYLSNSDYMLYTRSGRVSSAAARMGGFQGKVYDFFSAINDDWGWLLGFIFMLTIGVVLSPVFMLLAYKQNYLDPKSLNGMVRS